MSDGNIDLNSILPSSFWTDTGESSGEEKGELGMSTQSTLSTSEEDSKKMTINPAAVPMLMMPLMELGDLQTFLSIMFGHKVSGEHNPDNKSLVEDPLLDVQLRMHEIADAMLDGWAESLEETAQRTRTDDLRKMKAFVEVLRSEQRGDIADNAAVTAAIAVMATAGIVGGLGTTGAAVAPEMQAMVQAMTPLNAVIPAASRPDIAFIGAFYITMAVNAATLMTPIATTSLTGATNSIDAQMARNYARILVSTINNPSFDQQVAARLGNVSPEQLKQATAMVKVALLMTSLALLYKTETGGVTQEEMASLMHGEMDLVEEDMGRTLVVLIGIYLQQLPMEQRVKIIEGILEYVENAEVEELSDSARILGHIFSTGTSSGPNQRV